MSSLGGSDIFIAKLDLNGNCIWAKRAGGIADDEARAYISPSGLIYLVAEIKDSANFDSIKLPQGGCVARYDTSGNCIWAANKFDKPDSNEVFLDFINNDLIIYGNFNSSNMNLDTSTLQSNGGYDFFIARADSNANIKWIKHYGESGLDALNKLSIDDNKNIYVPCSFQNSIIIDSQTFNSSGSGDMLILKFDESGNLIQNIQVSSSGFVYGLSPKADIDGNLYISGYFSGTANFGTNTITSSTPYDYFLTRFDNSSNCLGVKNFTGGIGSSIIVDNTGNIVSSGGFQNTVNIGSNTFTSLGSYDIFIAKIGAITGLGGYNRVQQNQLVIYANPNKGTFNIKVPDDIKTFKDAMLIVYDNTGKETARFALDGQSDAPRFDVSNAVSGIYTVKLVQAEKIYIGKMVVE